MKILLAVDGSEYTQRVLTYVGSHEEFLSSKNQFTALAVIPPVPPQVTHHIARETLEDYYAEQAALILKPVMAFADQRHWELSSRHEVGHAAETIAKIAENGGFDMIVLGSHGYSAAWSLVLGSVASGVMARCKTPVLVIR